MSAISVERWMTHAAWVATGWSFLHFLWVGSLFTLLAWLGRLTLRQAHPDVRYVYSLASLFGFLLTPILIIAWSADREEPFTPRPSRAVPISSSSELVIGIPIATPEARDKPVSVVEPEVRLAQTVAEPASQSVTHLPWVAWFTWIWLMGPPLAFARLSLGLVGTSDLRRRGLQTDEALTDRARRLAEQWGGVRRVVVAISTRVRGPVLVGIVRPMILLPPAALSGWTADELEMALLHELAHLRRWDNVVNMLQRMVESLCFFHPGVWIISGWVEHDREHGCDRFVVDRTGRPLDYAEALFSLSTQAGRAGRVGLAMAEGPLLSRVRGIIEIKERSMKVRSADVILVGLPLLLPVVLLTVALLDSSIAAAPTEAAEDQKPAVEKGAERDASIDAAVTEAIDEMKKVNPVRASDRIYKLAQVQLAHGDKEGARRTMQEGMNLLLTSPVPAKPTPTAVRWNSTPALGGLRLALEMNEFGDGEGAARLVRSLNLMDPDLQANPQAWMMTAATFAHILALHGEPREAIEIRDRADAFEKGLPDPKKDEVNRSWYLAATHLASGDVDGAFAILDRVVEAHKQENLSSIESEFLSVFLRHLPARDRAKVADTVARILVRLDRLQTGDEKRRALISLADNTAEAGDFASARKTADRLMQPADKLTLMDQTGYVSALIEIAGHQIKAGDKAGARKTLDDARRPASVLGDSSFRSRQHERMVLRYLEFNEIAEALAVVEALTPGHRHVALVSIAREQRKRGIAGWRQTLERALADVAIDRGLPPSADELKFEAVNDTLSAQVLHGAYVNRCEAEIRALLGNIGEARVIAESIPPQATEQRYFAFTALARAQAAQGDVEGARRWIQSLDSKSGLDKVSLLAEVGCGALEARYESRNKQTQDKTEHEKVK